MYYAKKYPFLAELYSGERVELIISTLEKYFNDLFNLDVLNVAAENKELTAYTELFRHCMTHLQRSSCTSEVEIIDALHVLFCENKDVRPILENNYLFVGTNHKPNEQQIGFLEKLATGYLTPDNDPLTFVDMFRLTREFQRSADQLSSDDDIQYGVYRLDHLHTEYKDKASVMFVNLTTETGSMPKWCVVDCRVKDQSSVYCEAVITKTELATLQKALQLSLDVKGGTCSFPAISTGYTALAWTSENVHRTGALTLSSDFPALMEEFVFLLESGNIRFFHESDKQFMSAEYKSYMQNSTPAHALYRLASTALLGKLGEDDFQSNDLVTALKILQNKQIVHNTLHDNYFGQEYQNRRSFILGLDATLLDVGILDESMENTIALTVPETFRVAELGVVYSNFISAYRVPVKWFNHAARNPNQNLAQQPSPDELAAAMVLCVFRGRAKKQHLMIDFPAKYKLLPEEQGLIVKFMQDNAYVTELHNQANNPSIQSLNDQLLATFARNRWLAENHYKPPMKANYWREAARYWLLHYLPNTRTLLSDNEKDVQFRRCVAEMGLSGLKAVLAFLSKEADRVAILYEDKRPVFYAACQAHEMGEYLDALQTHLQSDDYFPFSEISLEYHPNQNDKLVQLLTLVNANYRDEITQVRLLNCMNDADEAQDLLRQLVTYASAHPDFVTLVILPESEATFFQNEKYRALGNIYTFLNNVILRNKRIQANRGMLEKLNAINDKSALYQPITAEDEALLDEQVEKALKTFPEAGIPWRSGESAQLQIQQQIQIEQEIQVQRKKQINLMVAHDESFEGEWVTYDNIDKVLGEYYKKYQKTNTGVELSNSECASQLKACFKTWISANPMVQAPFSMHAMTQEAAKMLLFSHRFLPSGLNPDNLPCGFFTERSVDNYLVLCYHGEAGYEKKPNPLTLKITTPISEATKWEGDFRQFDFHRYLSGDVSLDDTSTRQIVLFSMLQPKKDYSDDFEQFCNENPALVEKFQLQQSDNAEKIKKNWIVFTQSWLYEEEAGIRKFLELDLSQYRLSLTEIIDILLKDEQLKAWSSRWFVSEEYLIALGQVYYQHGEEGLQALLNKFKQIETVLGNEFFTFFNDTALSQCNNFNYFLSESFFLMANNMMDELVTKPSLLVLWQQVLKTQMQGVGWDNLETLWSGFRLFVDEVGMLDLTIEGDEFSAISPQNMFVYMDRVLACLRQLDDPEQRHMFLSHLADYDLSHGGVYYALSHDNVRFISPSLELRDFIAGTPSYYPDLANLYHWDENETLLKQRRALVTHPGLTATQYTDLLDPTHLGNTQETSKDRLVWLLHLDYPPQQVEAIWQAILGLDEAQVKCIASHVHHAIYQEGITLAVDCYAMIQLCQQPEFQPLLAHYKEGTVLEAVSLLWKTNRWDNVSELLALFETKITDEKPNCPAFFYRDGFKLAAIFGVFDVEKLNQFYQLVSQLAPLQSKKLSSMIRVLFSIESTNGLNSGIDTQDWDEFLACIEAMTDNPSETQQRWVDFLIKLDQKDVHFKYARNGEFRKLEAETDRPLLQEFPEHADRLWHFLVQHVVIPVDVDTKAALAPLMRFFLELQSKRAYLNELEPLLAYLEETPADHYWSSSYLMGLFEALMPPDDISSFPISLLKMLVQDEPQLAATPLNQVDAHFPPACHLLFQQIFMRPGLTRLQQKMLSQIALREYTERGNGKLFQQILNKLSSLPPSDNKTTVLHLFANCSSIDAMEVQYEHWCWLCNVNTEGTADDFWIKTMSLWLNELLDPTVQLLLQRIRELDDESDKKAPKLLHVIAWSSLDRNRFEKEAFDRQLNRKVSKLLTRLKELTHTELDELVACFPNQPSPSADDILRLLKEKQETNVPLQTCLSTFLKRPLPEPRSDLGEVVNTRKDDLQRLLANLHVSYGAARLSITAEQTAQIALTLAYIKNLEDGHLFIEPDGKSLSQMSQAELAKAFQELSQQSLKDPANPLVTAKIWAILFEVLGNRVGKKYPHLAQQVAFIANDILIESKSRVLQLATGEGKSHFVAMRAARQAGMGKVVDVCTAKESLAERDAQDYQAFFSYLGLESCYIDKDATFSKYMNSTIHYSTMGGFSLFLDQQSYNGTPISIARDRRVGLLDEYDFIVFEEGQKTEYNYARALGKTPKQMLWFYQAINAFYHDCSKEGIPTQNIDKNTLRSFVNHLKKQADSIEKKNIIRNLLHDPLSLARWLKAADEAHRLREEIDYTLVKQDILVGSEIYPVLEIVPLSSDSQKLNGSTFSAGVQQLLAVHLNQTTPKHNYHVHPESDIISSQVAAQRIHELWETVEGFTGTISSLQAAQLYQKNDTEILHVPTNQEDLRHWHEPLFFADNNITHQSAEELRYEELIKQIRLCLSKKQSILFACSNDREVKQVLNELTKPGRLTAEEQKQFIFYTNNSEKTPTDILQEKQDLEGWSGGVKQHGVVLAAAGFGRGDNVNVEAVFLIGVSDANDRLQKGGRTARNGEYGEVFQFYLTDAIVSEYRALREFISTHYPAAWKDVETLFPNTCEHESDTFNCLMGLRELQFHLENFAKQGYHYAVAMFSSWGMQLVGSATDPVSREALAFELRIKRRELEKLWVLIDGDHELTNETKIAKIEEKTREVAAALIEQQANHISQRTEFYLPSYSSYQTYALTPEKLLSPNCTTIAKIIGAFIAMPDLFAVINPTEITDLFKELDRLQTIDDPATKARIQHELLVLAKKINTASGAKELMSELKASLAKIKASSAWSTLRQTTQKSLTLDALWNEAAAQNAAQPLLTEFATKIEGLAGWLQSKLIDALCAPGMLSADVRIKKALPILNHLVQFSITDQQDNWAAAYIENMDYILNDNLPETYVAGRLEHTPPMGLHQFNTLSALASGLAQDLAHAIELTTQVGMAVKVAPAKRLRVYQIWENWIKNAKDGASYSFLIYFSHVMSAFDDHNWDVFETLVQKTQENWLKIGHINYQAELIDLWEQLADKKNDVQAYGPFLRWALNQPGKSAFTLAKVGLSFDMGVFNQYEAPLTQLWSIIEKQLAHKQEYADRLARLFEQFKCFDQVVNSALISDEISMLLKQLIQHVEPEKMDAVLDFISERQELIYRYPALCVNVLKIANQDNVSLDKLKKILRFYISITKKCSEEPFIIALFSEHTLNTLLNLNDNAYLFWMSLVEEYELLFFTRPDIFTTVLDAYANNINPEKIKKICRLFNNVLFNETYMEKLGKQKPFANFPAYFELMLKQKDDFFHYADVQLGKSAAIYGVDVQILTMVLDMFNNRDPIPFNQRDPGIAYTGRELWDGLFLLAQECGSMFSARVIQLISASPEPYRIYCFFRVHGKTIEKHADFAETVLSHIEYHPQHIDNLEWFLFGIANMEPSDAKKLETTDLFYKLLRLPKASAKILSEIMCENTPTLIRFPKLLAHLLGRFIAPQKALPLKSIGLALDTDIMEAAYFKLPETIDVLLSLDETRLPMMLSIMKEKKALLTAYPKLFQQLIQWLKMPAVLLVNIERLAQLLHHNVTHGQNIDHLLDGQRLLFLLTQAEGEFTDSLNMIDQCMDIHRNHPQLLQRFFDSLKQDAYTAKQVRRFHTILINLNRIQGPESLHVAQVLQDMERFSWFGEQLGMMVSAFEHYMPYYYQNPNFYRMTRHLIASFPDKLTLVWKVCAFYKKMVDLAFRSPLVNYHLLYDEDRLTSLIDGFDDSYLLDILLELIDKHATLFSNFPIVSNVVSDYLSQDKSEVRAIDMCQLLEEITRQVQDKKDWIVLANYALINDILHLDQAAFNSLTRILKSDYQWLMANPAYIMLFVNFLSDYTNDADRVVTLMEFIRRMPSGFVSVAMSQRLLAIPLSDSFEHMISLLSNHKATVCDKPQALEFLFQLVEHEDLDFDQLQQLTLLTLKVLDYHQKDPRKNLNALLLTLYRFHDYSCGMLQRVNAWLEEAPDDRHLPQVLSDQAIITLMAMDQDMQPLAEEVIMLFYNVLKKTGYRASLPQEIFRDPAIVRLFDFEVTSDPSLRITRDIFIDFIFLDAFVSCKPYAGVRWTASMNNELKALIAPESTHTNIQRPAYQEVIQVALPPHPLLPIQAITDAPIVQDRQTNADDDKSLGDDAATELDSPSSLCADEWLSSDEESDFPPAVDQQALTFCA